MKPPELWVEYHMETIPFYKMSGCGNDFIIIDNRHKLVDAAKLANTSGFPDGADGAAADALATFITKVCARRMAVGADGLILIESSATVDFKWHFYNSDGSRGEMCGNGARCAARFAWLNGIAGPEMAFETDAGVIEAKVGPQDVREPSGGRDEVRIKLSEPFGLHRDIRLDLPGGMQTMDHINTGVPHVVLTVTDLEDVDVMTLGRAIRRHSHFAPAGTNVNFICREEGGIAIRTYERGVENETLACGTGSAAAALLSGLKWGMPSPVRVHTRGGEMLTIYFDREDHSFRDVYLAGDARVVYTGVLHPESWQW